MLRISHSHWQAMIEHALAEATKPAEACGVVAGELGGADLKAIYPCKNAAAPERLDFVYELDSGDYLKADRDAQGNGWEIIGVYHSHTHTEALPSPTDIAQAPDPSWHYILISTQLPTAVVRSFSIVAGEVTEEPVVVEGQEAPSAEIRR